MPQKYTPQTLLSTVYAITDPGLLPADTLIKGVEQALSGGVRTVQYRDKTTDYPEKLAQACKLMSLCQRYQAQLIINDDITLASECKADGIHLGQEDTPLKQARAILGKHSIIGITCHNNLALAKQAEKDGADYVAFGRFFSSNTKPEASMAPLALLQSAKRELQLPVVAIGGITHDNMPPVIEYGADAIAVCHSLFAANDIAAQAKRMLATAHTIIR